MGKTMTKDQLVVVMTNLMVAEMKEQGVVIPQDEIETYKDDIKEFLEEHTVEELIEMTQNPGETVKEFTEWVDAQEGEESEDDSDVDEQDLKEILDNLHVGFNVIPGIGAGYCADENDLAHMKVFVAGAIAMKKAAENYL